MNKIQFDKNGFIASQKIRFKIKHDEETEELLKSIKNTEKSDNDLHYQALKKREYNEGE